MKKIIQTYSMYIVISIFVVIASNMLDSNALFTFLEENLVLLIVAIFALNATTNSLLIAKLVDIEKAEKDKGKKVDFTNTYQAIASSFSEQMYLILAALLIMMLGNSSVLLKKFPIVLDVKRVAYLTMMISTVQIIYDTSNSLFKINDFKKGN